MSHVLLLLYEEMNEALISIWNSTIQPKDTIFHLGDFSFGNVEETMAILQRLNGKIHLIQGNHDIDKNTWRKFN